MHVVMVYVKDIAQPFGLRFNDRAKAESVYTGIRDLPNADSNGVNAIAAHDDHGQSMSALRRDVQAIGLVDIEKDLAAQGDIQLLHARANARLQSLASADPVMAMHAGGRAGGLIRPQ